MLPDRCLSCSLPVCPVSNVGVLWPNGWSDQDGTWHDVGLGPGHIVLDGDLGPPSPKGHSPQFSALIFCRQMARWIKMSLGGKVGLDPIDIVLDGDPVPFPSLKVGRAPQFSADVYVAALIKMPLGMEVGLRSGHIVLDGDPAPPSPRPFTSHICCGQMAGWIKMPLGTKVGIGQWC